MTAKKKEAVEKVLALLKESKIDTQESLALIEAILDKEVDVRYVPWTTGTEWPWVTYKQDNSSPRDPYPTYRVTCAGDSGQPTTITDGKVHGPSIIP